MFNSKHGRIFIALSLSATTMACSDPKLGQNSTTLVKSEVDSLFNLCQDFKDDSLYPLKQDRVGDRVESKVEAYGVLNRYGQVKDQSMINYEFENKLEPYLKKSKSYAYSEQELEVDCMDHWSDIYDSSDVHTQR